MGVDWNHQKASLRKQKKTIDKPLLQQISAVLNNSGGFLNFDEEQAVNVIANTFNDNAMFNAINHNLSSSAY
ncbi:hypothetical protein D3C72_930180 [compost metagenome]